MNEEENVGPDQERGLQDLFSKLSRHTTIACNPLVMSVMGESLCGKVPPQGWTLETFLTGMEHAYAQETKVRAEVFWEVFSSLFEELSQETSIPLSDEIMQILRTTFDDVMQEINKDAGTIAWLFSSSPPVVSSYLALWRKTLFLCNLAFHYQRSQEPILSWFRTVSSNNSVPGLEQGIQRVYDAYMRGDNDF